MTDPITRALEGGMKYRKKPVVIDAVQFTEEMRVAAVLDGQPCPEGVLLGGRSYHRKDRKIWSAVFYIETLEGRMVVDVGDWIITGIKGERYPCKPDIFALTYEPVLEEAMTDLITRARKEWCETRPSPYTTSNIVICVCPPDVVAALLDVVQAAKAFVEHVDSGCGPQCASCKIDGEDCDCGYIELIDAIAAITRALEGK